MCGQQAVGMKTKKNVQTTVFRLFDSSLKADAINNFYRATLVAHS